MTGASWSSTMIGRLTWTASANSGIASTSISANGAVQPLGSRLSHRFEIRFNGSPSPVDDAYQRSETTATVAWHAAQVH
ncbi:hypothetical protein GON03_05050 [Nocardioides sp. MAH-18]|uniref:Uncharacterized protein n=1 Tax=Nocardioides agri TaxID=2682843 RepID=A0A6L6XNN1_9ACTN|nr:MULTISPECIES: hypothetical protein [unclassified Nocardioides]MBA2953674.1 hypothetical protein [Nocardioides sp. CGMCC 1.13656]MVQ48538.1 hypothetical protein [Nocardioides sp. MAH-18]